MALTGTTRVNAEDASAGARAIRNRRAIVIEHVRTNERRCRETAAEAQLVRESRRRSPLLESGRPWHELGRVAIVFDHSGATDFLSFAVLSVGCVIERCPQCVKTCAGGSESALSTHGNRRVGLRNSSGAR